MTVGQTLYLVNSVEAVEFYCDAFGLNIGYNAKNEDGTYLHAELEKDGNGVFAISESRDLAIKKALIEAEQPTTSLGISLDNNDELEHAFSLLAKGGHVLRPLGKLPWSPYSADLVDRYGVCWYIYVTQHKPED